jgi:excisionase family DNA binding protein
MLDREYLSPEEAEKFLGLKKQTLAHMRSQGRGPGYFKLGRLIRYRVADLEAWIGRHAVKTAN